MMATKKETPAKSTKKVLREQVEKGIKKTFAKLRKTVGEKKFDKHVKKASKILVKGATKKAKEAKKEKTKQPA